MMAVAVSAFLGLSSADLVAYAEFALIILVIVLFVVEKTYEAIINSSAFSKLFPGGWVTKIRNREIERRKRELIPVLDTIGFDKSVRERISRMADTVSIESVRISRAECIKRLDPLIKKYKRRLAVEKSFGTVGKTDIEWPVDFMDAVCNPEDLNQLAIIMSSFILDEIQNGHMKEDYDYLAGIREGNPYFVGNIGNLLQKEVIVLKSETTRRYKDDEFDGLDRPSEDQRIILVDDCILSGDLKLKTITTNRFGTKIKDAFVLIERKEGHARELFQNKGIVLHSLCMLSDDDISKMKESEKQGA
jgi:orotate phosphoribosyltransferase